MPTINTFQDPRYQAAADFFSVLQYRRLQEEIRHAERVARQQRLVGTLGGAVVGGIGGLIAAPAGGLVAAGGGSMGAGGMAAVPTLASALPGVVGGAALGAQIGSQLGGGDIAGGIATAAQGIGQMAQDRQDVQQFGFRPTKLDRSEISKLSTMLGKTTRQTTGEAKEAGVPIGPYLSQQVQEQAAQRSESVFEAQMAQREGMSPDDIRSQDPSGQNDFGAGLQVVESQNDKERLAFQEKQLDQRLSQTELFRSMSETHDLRPAPDSAQQALRYRNAVLSPGAGVDAKQRLELLDRIVKDVENQPASLQWVRKQPPSAAEQVQALQPFLEAWTKAGYDPRISIGDDGRKTVSVTAPKDKDTDIEIPSLGVSIPRAQYLNRLNENYALGVSTLGTMTPTKEQMEQVYETAERVTVRSLLGTSPENMDRMIREEMARQEFPEEMAAGEAAAKLKAAVWDSPNIEEWPPGKIEQHKEEARVVFDFYMGLLEGGRDLDETQQRELDIAKRILEQ